MGKTKKTRKYAAVKRMISANDPRVLAKQVAASAASATKKTRRKTKDGGEGDDDDVRHLPQLSSALFFRYNTQLGPPYRVIMDTNFINFSIVNKLDPIPAMMDCLYAKCIPCVTDCVVGELEKLGTKYRLALHTAKDPRFEQIRCTHAGTYADDCLVNLATQHKCYIIATCDRDLKRRIRKIPGVPIMYITKHQYSVERMPEALGAPRT